MARKEYFSFPEETGQFDKALTELIQNLAHEKRDSMLPSENIMHYSHGTMWVATSSDSSDAQGEMKVHSTETMISMDDIRQHKLEALPNFLEDIVKKMHESMMRMMYQTVSDSCEQSGNTVSAKDYETQADAFLATLKKIEFGVDRTGNVSMPELHVHPKAFAKFKEQAEAKGQPFKDEVDKVIKEKSEEALEREKKRIARFKD